MEDYSRVRIVVLIVTGHSQSIATNAQTTTTKTVKL